MALASRRKEHGISGAFSLHGKGVVGGRELSVETDLPPSLTPEEPVSANCYCCRRSLTPEQHRACTKCRRIVCSACSKTRIPDPVDASAQRACDACMNEMKREKVTEMRRNSALKKRSSGRLLLNIGNTSPVSCPSPRPRHLAEEAELARMAQEVHGMLQSANFKLTGMSPEEFEDVRILGRGATGAVLLTRHTPTDHLYAVKILQLGLDFEMAVIEQELSALQMLSHRNLVAGLYAYMRHQDVHIVLEYLDRGSLEDVAKTCSAFPDAVLAFITHEIVEGLHFLHTPSPENPAGPLIHRDLKPANILVNSHGEVKIGDFGILTAFKTSAHAFVGTGKYMSPERIRGEKYSTVGDIWSLGISLAELALGRSPLDHVKCINFMGLYAEVSQLTLPPLPEGHSQMTHDFIAACLSHEPFRRPTAAELKAHPWLRSASTQHQFVTWLLTLGPPEMQSPQSDVSNNSDSFQEMIRLMSGLRSGESFQSPSFRIGRPRNTSFQSSSSMRRVAILAGAHSPPKAKRAVRDTESPSKRGLRKVQSFAPGHRRPTFRTPRRSASAGAVEDRLKGPHLKF
jgi:mitogen-activated protein kinase kinase